MNIIRFEQINDRIIALRNKQVLLDSDVAELYGVETRDINKAVKNNPEKFPEGYVSRSKRKMNWWKISTGSGD